MRKIRRQQHAAAAAGAVAVTAAVAVGGAAAWVLYSFRGVGGGSMMDVKKDKARERRRGRYFREGGRLRRC